jgi:hypothetical protein
VRLPVWQWNPDTWTPDYIAGSDLIMRDSMYARFRSAGLGTCFGRGVQKSPTVRDNCVVCEPMNDVQRIAFLTLHADRYGCHLKDPRRYAWLVCSIESVEYILCMYRAGVEPEASGATSAQYSSSSRLRLMTGFPSEFARFLKDAPSAV